MSTTKIKQLEGDMQYEFKQGAPTEVNRVFAGVGIFVGLMWTARHAITKALYPMLDFFM